MKDVPGLPRRYLAPGMVNPPDSVESIRVVEVDMAFQRLLAPPHFALGHHLKDLPLLVMPMTRCVYVPYALVDTALALVAGCDGWLESSVIDHKD